MPERVQRKYGEATIIDFTLFENDALRIQDDASSVTGDSKIRMDEGALADTTNNFAFDGTGSYSIALESTEMTAKRLYIPIRDQGTPQWRDEYLMVETFGDTNAQQAFNLDADLSTNTETWKFKEIDIHNDSGVGLSVISGTSNAVRFDSTSGNALHLSVSGGTGNALLATTVAASGIRVLSSGGHALDLRTSGSGGTNGVYIEAGTGYGVVVVGASANAAVRMVGGPSGGAGLELIGQSGGAGMSITGGSSGNGLELVAGYNGNALDATGAGSGSAFDLRAGATGNGLELVGGATSGNAMDMTTSDGKGINIDAVGDHGFYINAQSNNHSGIRIDSSNNGLDILSTGSSIKASSSTSNALLLLAQGNVAVNISSDVAPALSLTTNGTNAPAVFIRGNDSGAGMDIGGGATGNGVDIVGGATSGHAVALSATSGNALDATGGGSGHGFDIRGGYSAGDGIKVTGGFAGGYGISTRGGGNRSGLYAIGGETGHGIEAFGGASSGSGIKAEALAVSDHGMSLVGGASGNALDATGGGGIHVEVVNGDALYLKAGGTDYNGIRTIGSTTGDGIRSSGGSDGAGIHAMGGGTSGSGIKAEVLSTDATAVELIGSGTGSGLSVYGGATGHAVLLVAGHDRNALDATGGGFGSGVHFRGGPVGAGIKATGLMGMQVQTTGGNYAASFEGGVTMSGNGNNGLQLVADPGGYALRCLGGSFLQGGPGQSALRLLGNMNVGLETAEIGTPPTLFDGTASPSIYAMLTAMSDSSGGSDFTSVQDSLVAIAAGGGGGGGGDVNVVSIDGQLTSGNNAVLNLKQLNIVNNSGSAIVAHSTGGNGHGLDSSGAGTGDGFNIRGGLTGHGVEISGGATSGDGISISTTNGHATNIAAAGAGKNGINLDANNGMGINVTAAGTGLNVESFSNYAARLYAVNEAALHIRSDGSLGVEVTGPVIGVKIDSYSAGGIGMQISGVEKGLVIVAQDYEGAYIRGGGGSGLKIEGGGTAHGLELVGGAISGNGIDISTTSGDGIKVAALGTGHGMNISSAVNGVNIVATGIGNGVKILGGPSGGDALYVAAQGGNSNGVSFVKNGSGADINAEEVTALLKVTTPIDGVNVDTVLQYIQAMANGRFLKNTPTANDITFFKRDNSTPLFVVHVTDLERTRL